MPCTETVSAHYLNHDDPVQGLMYASSGFNVISSSLLSKILLRDTHESDSALQKLLDSGVTKDTPI